MAVPNTEASAAPVSPAREANDNDSSVTVTAPHHRVASKAAEQSNFSETSSLEAEVAALDRARTVLAGGDPARALALLNQYEQTFPKGVLRPEASYLRIEALSQSGQRGAARDLAARFLARHPKSLHAAQLRALLLP
jgi:TolA-binding protein